MHLAGAAGEDIVAATAHQMGHTRPCVQSTTPSQLRRQIRSGGDKLITLGGRPSKLGDDTKQKLLDLVFEERRKRKSDAVLNFATFAA